MLRKGGRVKVEREAKRNSFRHMQWREQQWDIKNGSHSLLIFISCTGYIPSSPLPTSDTKTSVNVDYIQCRLLVLQLATHIKFLMFQKKKENVHTFGKMGQREDRRHSGKRKKRGIENSANTHFQEVVVGKYDIPDTVKKYQGQHVELMAQSILFLIIQLENLLMLYVDGIFVPNSFEF